MKTIGLISPPSRRTALATQNQTKLKNDSILWRDGTIMDIVKEEMGEKSFTEEDVIRVTNEVTNKAVEEALLLPLLKLMELTDFDKKKNIMNIYEGSMSTGKTWMVPNKLAKLWFDSGKDLLVYTTPECSALSDVVREFRDWKGENNMHDVEIVQYDSGRGFLKGKLDTDEVQDFLNDGKKVIYICNHQKLCTKDKKGRGALKRKLFLESVAKLDKMVMFVDEVHTWLISCKENQMKVRGSSSEKYKGSLYNFISKKIAPHTAWVFGASATTTVEHNGIVKTGGSLKFNVVNAEEAIQLSKFLIFRRKWKESLETFNPNSSSEVKEKIDGVVDYLLAGEKNANVKRTAAFQCDLDKDDNSRSESRLYNTIEEVQNNFYDSISRKKPDFSDNDYHFGVTIATDPKNFCGGGSFRINKNGEVIESTQDDLFDRLADKNDSLIAIGSIYKGNASINVNNYSVAMAFRQSDKRTGIKEQPFATQSIKQFVGRCFRVMKNTIKVPGFFGGAKTKSSPDTDRFYEGSPMPIDMVKFIATASDEELEELLHAQSYKVLLAETKCNKLAIDELNEHYTVDVQDVYEEMLKLRALVNKSNIGYNHLAKIKQANGMKFEKSAMDAISSAFDRLKNL